METNEIVTELYALRAGLSLISKEKDAFESEVRQAEMRRNGAIENAKSIADNEIRNAEDRVYNAKQTKLALNSKLASAKSELEEAQRAYDKNNIAISLIPSAEKELCKIKRVFGIIRTISYSFVLLYLISAVMLPIVLFVIKPSNIGYLLIPFTVTAFLLGIAAIIFYSCDGRDLEFGIPYILNILLIAIFMILGLCGIKSGFWFWAVFILAMISILVCMVFTGIYAYNGIDDSSADKFKHDISDGNYAQSIQSDLKEKKCDAERRYSDIEKEYNSALIDVNKFEIERNTIVEKEEEKRNTICTEVENEYQATYYMAVSTYGKTSSEIWDTLVKSYGELLDVRDWNILDLVIWQLETGRAETLKEALQLADRETQTDRIVQTMKSASEAIAQRIDMGFGNLQTQLSNSFYTLAVGLTKATSIISSQISSSSNRLAEKIDKSNQTTAALYESQRSGMIEANRNLEQLFSQSSLQSALSEKAYLSSQNLIDEVKKLREAQKG